MYDLKRSIRRHAVGCAGLLCLILVVALASRCTGDSITGAANPSPENPVLENPAPQTPAPLNPAPENPGPEDPSGTPSEVGSVTLTPESLRLAEYGDTAQLTVIVRDRTGAVIANPQVVFLIYGLDGLRVGTVDSTGLVTGLGCGVGRIIARSRGVYSNTVLISVGPESGAGCWGY